MEHGRPTFLFDADCGVCQDGTDRILKAIGPWMYAHRGYLPGATDACKVPAA